MRWVDSLRDEIIRAARQSRTMPELAQRASAIIGEPVHEEQVRGAVRRWRMRWPEIPELARLLGADLRGVQVANTNEAAPSADLLAVDDDAPIDLDLEIAAAPVVVPAVEHVADEVVSLGVTGPCRMIVESDDHFPYHNPEFQDAKLAFARDFRPDMIVNLGDRYDFLSVSSYPKSGRQVLDPRFALQAEFDSARPYWAEACRIAARVVYLPGNHESRGGLLDKQYPGLFGLRAFDLKSMAEIPAKVEVMRPGQILRAGPLFLEHGDKIGGRYGCKNPAQWYMQNHGDRNVIFGHHHKHEVAMKTKYYEDGPQQIVAISQGHGTDPRHHSYTSRHNWCNSFTAVEFYEAGGRLRFSAYQLIAADGRFSWNGTVYGRGRCQ